VSTLSSSLPYYYAGTSSISANVPFGAQTMATPDGRKAHTPLAEGAPNGTLAEIDDVPA
jgi:pyruvate-formate lyase